MASPCCRRVLAAPLSSSIRPASSARSEEHTSELQSHVNLVCRLLLEKKKLMSEPRRLDAERLKDHVDAVGCWDLEDVALEVIPEYVIGVIAETSYPGSDF